MKRFFIFLILIQIFFIFIISFYLITKTTSVPADIFFVKNKYYSYKKIEDLNHFYELRENLGKINDLTNIPEWLSYRPTYFINKDGLNDKLDYGIKKAPRTFRIIALGDSFTFGLFVNIEDSWPKKLETLLNKKLFCKNIDKFEVINLGMQGYDLQYEVQRYKNKGTKYDPDVVIWLLKDEDLDWIIEYIIPKIKLYEKGLSEKQKKSVMEWKFIWKNVKDNYLKEFSQNKIIELNKSYLHLFTSYFTKKLVIINLPEYSTKKEYKDLLHQFIQNRTNSFLFDQFPQITKINGTFPETHPNNKGHKIIAESLFEYMTKNKLIPCE